ncbi:type IV toxin-antitoxin system AbiEi family antitoxin domain-containing protein [Microbacterium suaedae]|uniref:type IV toxin-antitoxin system AbiEi family antitoxin domain-containing protein n=1 Tax=Microbacterium suaedae TaxID=2067813 RepID=UPI000DA1E00C|nr:type IV toxin-antitoxin system AbiEi family antitoxin domain-containing protein [Microbacterium suaedae]
MKLVEIVRRRGGVCRTADLLALGITRNRVRAAVASGALHRPRQGWVALQNADPMLVAAARAGVVLTCLTQAARIGLWSQESSMHHVAAPPHAGRVDVDELHARVHWSEPLVPRVPGVLVDPIENVLTILAACVPEEQARATWESALRKKYVDIEALRQLPLSGRARRIAEIVTPFSDAGTESIVVHRLRWLDERILQQVVIAGHRVDILIGECLVIQIDGGHHIGAQRDQDNAHDARLRLMGYHVIRVSYAQIMNEWPVVQDLVLRAIARGLHRFSRGSRRVAG